ncbi:MAG: AI-2E family transporter [Paludibacteraceae bacterium]|nr:AI-2E family transporter [Paludibacteraceae bacterium]
MFSRLYGVLLPFFVSFLLAYVLDPIVVFIQTKCRVRNRALAVVVTLVLAVGIVAGAVAALRKPVMDQVNTAWAGFQSYIATFDINQYVSAETQEKLLQWQENWDWKSVLANPELTTSIKEMLPKIGNWITGGLSWMSELLVVFIGFMYLIFLMIDFPNIRANYSRYIPRKIRPRVVTLMGDIDRNMNAYFRGQAMVATCVGILFAIGFTITGMPMGIAMGLIIGLLNMVPYMQALGIPPCIVLCLIQSAQTGQPVWLTLLLMTVVFIVVQSIQDMVLTPKIMGNVTGMSPAAILLSLSIWGALCGVIGMIIALPITTLIISYYDRYVANRGVSSRAHQAEYRGRLRRPKENQR